MELLERTIPRAVSCCFRLVCRDVSVPRFGSLIVLLRFASVTVSRNTRRNFTTCDTYSTHLCIRKIRLTPVR